jgi:hypothetical protein
MPITRSFLRPFIECASPKRTTYSNGKIGVALAVIRNQSPFGESGNMHGFTEYLSYRC